jgi:hypothetical protein
VNVRVVELYASFRPAFDCTEAVRRLLESLPPEQVRGLDAVVLRDCASLTAQERRRGLAKCRGFYVRRRRGRLPHVELLVDNVFAGWPKWTAYVPILRVEILYQVLFHELAHHRLDRRSPWKTRSEARADQFGRALARASFRRRHPRLLPAARRLRALVAFLRARRGRNGATT